MAKIKRSGLQYSLLFGAIYDWFFGLFILFIPSILAKIIRLEMPTEELYLRLNGLLFLIIGTFYFLYWLDKKQYKGVVPIAIAARSSGFLFFFIAWATFKYPFTFLLLGIGDGVWAAIHLILLPKKHKKKKK
jgi:hypothetical protein